MINLFKLMIDFILPPRCLLCGKILHRDDSLCTECFDHITFITKPYCKHCGAPLSFTNYYKELYCVNCLNDKKTPLYLCRSAICYDDSSKKLILDFKFADHLENKKLFSRWLHLAGKDIFADGVDAILPVPLHYSRLFKRKYNQSAILARELSKISNVPVYYNVLKKCKYTKPQVLCSSKQRQKNIKDAFVVKNSSFIEGKHIVLIDDVYTTGATLKECAKILIKSGAKKVSALTVARVVD